jgi:heme-degrading monooxygenase HmoA
MILEHADITIPAGKNAEFEEAIQRGIATVIATAKGFIDAQVRKGIESPERYILTIHWETLENHTVDFRGGPLFPAWRAIVGPFFAKPPVVEHFDLVATHA